MTPEQKALFLANHAGLWCWPHPSGVYIARSIWEGRTRFRTFPTFLVQHYPFRPKTGRYGTPVTIYQANPLCNIEADLLLSRVIAQPLEQLFTEIGQDMPEADGEMPPHWIYSRRGSGLVWPVDRSDGLYLITLKGRKNWADGTSLSISRRPYDLSKRWTTVFDAKVAFNTNNYTWEIGLADFSAAVTGIEDFLMEAML